MNEITMKLVADKLIMQALEEDITSEDITTNAVMRERREGEVELICKEDGIIAGLWVFERVFTLLDPSTTVTLFVKDGDEVKKGQKMGVVTGDIRTALRGAHGLKLSSENERNRDLYKKCGKTSGRNEDQTA